MPQLTWTQVSATIYTVYRSLGFLKVLCLFFVVDYAILKYFSYLLGAKFAGRNFYRWRHDNWPIGRWVTFHAAPDTVYVNHFFPRVNFIIWFKSIQAQQVDLKTRRSLVRCATSCIKWELMRGRQFYLVLVASHSYSGSALDVFFQYSTLYNCNFNRPCHGLRRHLHE